MEQLVTYNELLEEPELVDIERLLERMDRAEQCILIWNDPTAAGWG